MAPDPVATLNHPLGEIEIVKPEANDMKSSDAHLVSVRSCMFAYWCTVYWIPVLHESASCAEATPFLLAPRPLHLQGFLCHWPGRSIPAWREYIHQSEPLVICSL
jgi:hypothetical protein